VQVEAAATASYNLHVNRQIIRYLAAPTKPRKYLFY
jgi:hypothetical protein